MKTCLSTGWNQDHCLQQGSGQVFLSSGARQGEQDPTHPYPSTLEVIRASLEISEKNVKFCMCLCWVLWLSGRKKALCLHSRKQIRLNTCFDKSNTISKGYKNWHSTSSWRLRYSFCMHTASQMTLVKYCLIKSLCKILSCLQGFWPMNGPEVSIRGFCRGGSLSDFYWNIYTCVWGILSTVDI